MKRSTAILFLSIRFFQIRYLVQKHKKIYVMSVIVTIKNPSLKSYRKYNEIFTSFQKAYNPEPKQDKHVASSINVGA